MVKQLRKAENESGILQQFTYPIASGRDHCAMAEEFLEKLFLLDCMYV